MARTSTSETFSFDFIKIIIFIYINKSDISIFSPPKPIKEKKRTAKLKFFPDETGKIPLKYFFNCLE
jgi:hypothetical protein